VLVGTAEVLIVPVTTGFESALKKETAAGLSGFHKDAGLAGAAAGTNLRTGVTRESGKLAGDLEKDGKRAGDGLHKGMSGGLSKLAGALSATGLPLGALSGGLEKSASAAEHVDRKSSGLAGTLHHLGGIALAGVAGAAILTAGAAIHLGQSMQSADAAIAAASNTSVTSAAKIGDAFLKTGGASEFTAQQMARAFASVAGQLKATEGHALTAAQASRVMAAADALATGKQIDLGTATQATAGIMQAFKLQTGDAAHVTDVLFQASAATGQGVDTLANQLEKVRSKLGETSGSVGQLAGLLVDMTNQGVTGRAAMAALNGAMNSLLKPSKAATAAQHDLGLSVFDANGRFMGMRSVIEQLHPKLSGLTQQQQLLTVSHLFGAGAARQMLAVIKAGPAAYDKATGSVSKHGAAQDAAAKQSRTLHVEEQVLKAEVSDLGTRIGTVLIPIVTSMIGWFIKATTFVTDHKAVLIALGAVVVGILGPAIAVFTVNKMAAFGQSFVTAGSHVKSFASGVESAVNKVIGLFTKQSAAADANALNMQGNAAKGVTAAGTEATAVEGASARTVTANTTATTSFATTGTAAGTAATEIGVAETAAVTEVTVADTAIETANATAAASFLGILGPAGLVAGVAVAAGVAAHQLGGAGGAGNPAGATPGSRYSGYQTPTGFHGISPPAGISLPQSSGTTGLGNRGGETYAQQQANIAADTGPPAIASVAKAATVKAFGASVGASIASAALTPNQIRAIAYAAGFRGSALDTAVRVAEAESSGIPTNRYNPGSQEDSRGLWQINVAASANPQYASTNLYDPATNARIAYSMSHGGTNWQPWTTYTSGKYLSEPAGSGLGTPGGTGAPVVQVPAYINPFAGASGVSRSRTDQGVDFGFSGPLGAIGAGVIEKIMSFQGFGQTIEERLTTGAHKGELVYTALENGATLLAHAGETVARGQAIAQGRGSGGIEMGFAQGSGSQYGLPIDRYALGQSHNTPLAGGIRFSNFLASIAAGTAGTIAGTGSGTVAAAPALTAAQIAAIRKAALIQEIATEKGLFAEKVAAEKAALQNKIAGEKAALANTIAEERASVKGKHVPADQKAAVAQEIASQKAALATTIANQKSSLAQGLVLQRADQAVWLANAKAQVSTQNAAQKAELARQTSDFKAGTSLLNKMLTAIHSGSLKSLDSALFAAHLAGLSKIEHSLSHDHSRELAALSKELVAVHKQAQAQLTKELHAAAVAAGAKREAAKEAHEATVLNKQAANISKTAQDSAKQIADATAVTLDRQAEAGLTGASLVAAHAQTNLDVVTQSADKAIAAAQGIVDKAATGSALQQAKAAVGLAQAGAKGTLAEAQAAATLALAQAKANAAGTPTAGSPTAVSPNFNFTIYGAGSMTAAQLFAEVGWTLRTGALPVAPAVPVPG
jgi:TP901 family phage tail tape measure protein